LNLIKSNTCPQPSWKYLVIGQMKIYHHTNHNFIPTLLNFFSQITYKTHIIKVILKSY